MRRRFTILSLLVCIIAALALVSYGVYASLQQTFSVSNTIGFVASQDVYVALDCSISGSVQSNLTTPPSEYSSLEEYWNDIGVKHQVTFTEDMRGQNQNLSANPWIVRESLNFINGTTEIVYTIKVYNYSYKDLRVSFSSYVNDSQYIENEYSEPIIIDGYAQGEEASFKEVVLKTKVKDPAKGFKEEKNDFTLLFEVI